MAEQTESDRRRIRISGLLANAVAATAAVIAATAAVMAAVIKGHYCCLLSNAAGSPCELSIACGQGYVDALFGEHFADRLESLILRNRDRACVTLALYLPRRVFNVRLHQLLDCPADCHQSPGAFGEVVHKDVVTFLRVLPKVEHLGNGGDILVGALPPLVTIDRETAGWGAVVSAQIEDGLVVTDPCGAG